MRKQRSLWIVVSLLVIAGLIAGCGGAATQAPSGAGTQPTAAPPGATAAPKAAATAGAAAPGGTTKNFSGDLTFWSGYPEMAPLYDHAIASFKKLYPNVNVTYLTHPLREYEQKLATTLPTGTGPDLFEGSLYANAKFIEAGLMPETPAWVLDRTKGMHDESVQKYFTMNGKRYTVPFFEGRSAIFYNKDCLKEAGIAEPPADKPTSVDQFIEMAKKTAKVEGGKVTRAGLSLRLSGGGSGVSEKWWIMAGMWGLNGMLEETAPGKYRAIMNNEAGQKALQMYIDMLYNWKTDAFELKHDTEGFELGQACMFQRETWVIGDIAQKAPNLNYGTMPMPQGTKWGYLRNPNALWVTNSAKNPELAWEFALHLVNEDNQRFMLDNVGWLPSRIDVKYDDIIAKKPAFKAFLVNDPAYQAYYYPPTGIHDEIATKFADRLAKAYLDSTLANNPAGVKKVLDDAAAEANSILKREGKGGE